LDIRFRNASNGLRFPIYGNEVTDGIPDGDHFGSGSIALQRMLAQEGNRKIYLLPAWACGMGRGLQAAPPGRGGAHRDGEGRQVGEVEHHTDGAQD